MFNKTQKFSRVKVQSRKSKFEKSLCVKVRDNIEKFSLLTSLHGFKYVCEKDKSFLEKIFWICVLIFVFVLCAFQTFELIDYWNKGEILLTQETTKLNVWDVPFPAITLCSDNQVNASKLENLSFELNDTNDLQDVKDFADIMCFTNLFGNYTENELSETSLRYAFTPVILSTGVCYSLNMIPLDQLFHQQYADILNSYSSQKYFHIGRPKQPLWSVESMYKNRNSITPPWRVGGDGVHDAVKFAVDLKTDDFKHFCGISSSGLTLILHNPTDYPNPTSTQYLRRNVFSLIVINPQIVAASDSLRSWNPATRGCYYQNEKFLKFFKIYTLNNCELECRANKTLELCGCASHFYPRSGQSPVCGLSNRTCVSLAASTRFSVFQNKSSYIQNDNCDCLPSCLELTYDSQVTEVIKDWSKMAKVDSTIRSKNIAVVNIYFKKKSADYWIRSPMIRFNELVANVGGVMSLCVGCSIVSLFEILYFFILQRWLKKKKTRNDKNAFFFLR